MSPDICIAAPHCYTYRTESPLHSGFVGHPPATLEKRSPINHSGFVGQPPATLEKRSPINFYMEQNAHEILGLLRKFNTSWGAYVKYLNKISKSFSAMQKSLKAVTTGKVFGAVNKPLREIEELAKTHDIDADETGLAELTQAIAEAEGDDNDDDI